MDKNSTVAGLTYLFNLYIEKYCKKHQLSINEFIQLDDKFHILDLICDGADIFNDCTIKEGMKIIENHINYCRKSEETL